MPRTARRLAISERLWPRNSRSDQRAARAASTGRGLGSAARLGEKRIGRRSSAAGLRDDVEPVSSSHLGPPDSCESCSVVSVPDQLSERRRFRLRTGPPGSIWMLTFPISPDLLTFTRRDLELRCGFLFENPRKRRRAHARCVEDADDDSAQRSPQSAARPRGSVFIGVSASSAPPRMMRSMRVRRFDPVTPATHGRGDSRKMPAGRQDRLRRRPGGLVPCGRRPRRRPVRAPPQASRRSTTPAGGTRTHLHQAVRHRAEVVAAPQWQNSCARIVTSCCCVQSISYRTRPDENRPDEPEDARVRARRRTSTDRIGVATPSAVSSRRSASSSRPAVTAVASRAIAAMRRQRSHHTATTATTPNSHTHTRIQGEGSMNVGVTDACGLERKRRR